MIKSDHIRQHEDCVANVNHETGKLTFTINGCSSDESLQNLEFSVPLDEIAKILARSGFIVMKQY